MVVLAAVQVSRFRPQMDTGPLCVLNQHHPKVGVRPQPPNTKCVLSDVPLKGRKRLIASHWFAEVQQQIVS